MKTDLQALWSAIQANPDDDSVRAAFADELIASDDEHHQLAGQFMHLQLKYQPKMVAKAGKIFDKIFPRWIIALSNNGVRVAWWHRNGRWVEAKFVTGINPIHSCRVRLEWRRGTVHSVTLNHPSAASLFAPAINPLAPGLKYRTNLMLSCARWVHPGPSPNSIVAEDSVLSVYFAIPRIRESLGEVLVKSPWARWTWDGSGVEIFRQEGESRYAFVSRVHEQFNGALTEWAWSPAARMSYANLDLDHLNTEVVEQ